MTGRYRKVPDWIYYFGVLPTLSLLPRRLSAPLLRLQARYFHRVQHFHRGHAEQNVQEFLGERLSEEARANLVRRSFENWIWEDFETFRFPFWNPGNVDRRFRFDGLRHLDQAWSEGRGVLLITAHIGSTAAGVIALSLKGYPVQLLLHDSPSDTSVPAALRAYSRLKIRWMRDKSLRDPVLMDLASGPGDKGQALLKGSRVLRRNGILIVAIDVPPHLIGNRQPVTFLGRDCLFPAGFLQLAYLTGSPIVPYFPRREGDNWNHQSISVGPPVPLTRDLQTDLQSCVDRLEARIRLSPEQWLSWDSASHFLAPEPP